jgi:adenosylcobinamide-GDP ribazoletransferase
MAFGDELAAALACVTVLGRRSGRPAPTIVAGLAWLPLVGLGIGAIVAGLAVLVGTVSPRVAGALGVLLLAALDGARGTRGVAGVAGAFAGSADAGLVRARLRAAAPWPAAVFSVALVGLRAVCAAVMPAPARTTALLIAPMLGAWAIVVQCYGGTPVHARGPAAAVVGRARFREFGWASVVALGVTLSVAEAIGLLVVLVASTITIGLRVYAHRRVGGLTGRILSATRELVETGVIATLALLAAVVSPG